jgi:predicted acylesterase/phospholipase RssA
MTPRLRIAVVLPGGLSFGAYEAGVCSSLVEVVKTSRGEVVVDLIVGASCGAVTGLMTALALRHADALSHLEELWVERASLRWLVWPRSSSGAWSPLSTTALERWGQVVFSTAHGASLQDEPVRLLVALAPLDGADTLMPSGLDQDGRELFSATWSFRDARRYVLGDERSEWFEALDSVLASAAHPLGFAPRKLPDLSGLLRDATWFTDGGASDNLPLHLALDALDAEPCDDATRLVVIVNRPVSRPDPIASPTFVSTGLRALKMLWEGPLLGDLLKGRALPAPLMIVSPDPMSLESTGWANIRGFFSRSIRQRDFARGQRDFFDRWLESAWSITPAPPQEQELAR